jgi:hypothetical protein
MSKVSSLTAVGSHSIGHLARVNLESTLLYVVAALVLGVPLILALLIAQAPGSADTARWRPRVLVAFAVATAVVLPFAVGWRGGSDEGRFMIALALAGLVVSLLAALLGRPGPLPGGTSGLLVVGTLVVVPFVQAAGTNVPLLYVAYECLAMWVAAVLVLLTRANFPVLMVTAALADLAVVVVVTALIAGSTTFMSPFKTSGYDDAHGSVARLGVTVSVETARQYDALEAAVAPYVVDGRTPVFAMDQNAGLTYLVGGVPAGSTWNDSFSPTRTAGILELACRNGDVASPPVLLLSRPVDGPLGRALDACGFDYPSGYRGLPVPGGPPDLTVLVPVGS